MYMRDSIQGKVDELTGVVLALSASVFNTFINLRILIILCGVSRRPGSSDFWGESDNQTYRQKDRHHVFICVRICYVKLYKYIYGCVYFVPVIEGTAARCERTLAKLDSIGEMLLYFRNDQVCSRRAAPATKV